ncbi:unnamed protein product [Phaeothamnion confervicola]
MVAMMHPGEPYNNERDRIEAVLDAMWPFVAGTYTAGEDGSVWYVLDEAGSAVRHSDNPSAKMIPFVYYTGACEEARICSILWPIRNLSCGETVTRDFLPRNLPEGDDAASLLRQARLCAFEPVPPELKERCRAELAAWRQSLAAWGEQGNAERGVGRNAAAVDAEERNADRLPSMARPDGTPLKVFSELPYVAAELTRPEFEMVDDAGAADIIWASRAVDAAFKAAVGGLKPGCVVSQFPYEGAIVLKHHLASTVAREFGDRGFARQIPATYTLPSQLLAFMADFWERAEREGSPNFWVLKPCDLARSKGTVVCGNLAQALRQLDLGPRVVQSYVAAPLLFRGRKVDLRVVALLRSARPLELYAYDRFWPRVAARPYDCSSATALADQRVSLTAMHLLNGGDGGGGGGGGGGDGDGGGNDGDDRGDGGCSSSRVSGAEGKSGFHHHVDETEFVAEIEATHPGVCWADVMRAIHAIIRAVFVAAARQQPGMASAESRAIYGCDIILTEDLEPRLLEVHSRFSFCLRCKLFMAQSVWVSEAPMLFFSKQLSGWRPLQQLRHIGRVGQLERSLFGGRIPIRDLLLHFLAGIRSVFPFYDSPSRFGRLASVRAT